MEEVIKELEKKLQELQAEEWDETLSLAIDKAVRKTAISDSPFSDIASKLEHAKSYNSIKKNSIRSVPIESKIFKENMQQKYPGLYEKCHQEIQNNNQERAHVIYILMDLIERLKSSIAEELVEFETIKKAFDYIGLNANLQLCAFVYIIALNANLHRLTQSKLCTPNIDALIDYDYKYITREEVVQILINKQLNEFFDEKEPKNPLGQQELYERFIATKIDYTDHQKWCDELDELFSKKVYDLTDEDFEHVIELMNNLSFGDLAHRVIRQMKREAASSENISNADEKSISELSSSSEEKPVSEKRKEKKNKISQKEKRHVYHEIDKLYDLENLKAKTYLSLDEIIYLLSLMYSIEMDENIITKFLESVMHPYQKGNPIAIYYQTKEKFARLGKETPEIKEHQEMIEYILHDFNDIKGLNIFMCSDEEYYELKSLIAEEIDALMRLADGNYTYEIEKAKSLLKKNEE